MRKWWPDIQMLAEDQSGLFTAAQAQALGATRPALGALVESGLIERQLHGIYLVVGTPVDRFTPVRAAWLSLDPRRTAEERLASEDPGGVVTHRTAALLLDIGDLDADRHEFTTRQRRRSRNPDLQLHQGDPGEWMVHHGLPVSTPGQTLATLAHGNLDLDHLATLVNDATRRWGLTRADLRTHLEPSAHRYDHHDVDDLLDDLLITRGNTLRHTTDLLGPTGTDALTRTLLNELHAALQVNVDAVMPKFNVDAVMPKFNVDAVMPKFNVDAVMPKFNVDAVMPRLNPAVVPRLNPGVVPRFDRAVLGADVAGALNDSLRRVLREALDASWAASQDTDELEDPDGAKGGQNRDELEE